MAGDFRRGIDWKKACAGVPTDEYAIRGRDLSDLENLEGVVESFVNLIEDRSYLVWEAVIRVEQDLPLSKAHQAMLRKLSMFNDEDDERILFIDERPRPCEPWYDTLNRIAPHLLVETYDTASPPVEVIIEGWSRVVEALDEHGQHLSLPRGITVPVDVVPDELRNRLWIQTGFDVLLGIGSEGLSGKVISLEDEEELYRIDQFIEFLQIAREHVQALDLTLEKLLKVLVMPPRERDLFVELFLEALGLSSEMDPIAEVL